MGHGPQLYAQTLLHRHFYAETLLHAAAFTQMPLHTAAFTHRHFYTQLLLHIDFYTRMLLHRRFYTDAFAHKRLKLHRPQHNNTFSSQCPIMLGNPLRDLGFRSITKHFHQMSTPKMLRYAWQPRNRQLKIAMFP